MAYGMRAWIDVDQAGLVERLDGELVVTEFFCVIVPVWPQRSFYVRRTAEGVESLEIALHPTSVAAGILRTSTWMAALIIGLPGLVARDRWAWLLPVGLALAALAAVFTFVLGRLSPAERERRALLRRAVGLGAPPELLPPPFVEATRKALEGRWRADHDPDWIDAIARGESSELLIAVAEYNLRPELAAQARANLHESQQFN